MDGASSSVGVSPHKDKERDNSRGQRQRRQKVQGSYSIPEGVTQHILVLTLCLSMSHRRCHFRDMALLASWGLLGGVAPVIAVWPLE